MRAVAVFRFIITDEVPDIEALPGDILVWEYPRVSLYRRVRLGEQFTLLNLLPQHWVYVILKYDDRITPLDDAPQAAELIALLPRAHARNPDRAPAGEESPQLRLLA